MHSIVYICQMDQLMCYTIVLWDSWDVLVLCLINLLCCYSVPVVLFHKTIESSVIHASSG